jgi:hypothetical protein
MSRFATLALGWGLTTLVALGQVPPKPPADAWFTEGVVYPAGVATNATDAQAFDRLHVEIIAGKVKVVWPKGELPESSRVVLSASADTPGHWRARDWRTYPMTKRGVNWEATPPVDNVDIPLLYCVKASIATGALVSPMRICRPRAAGLEDPSRVFWPFLEGFEDDLESWRLIDAGNAAGPLKKGAPPKNGKAALTVSLAAGKHSVTVATTRARGWQIEEKAATGLRLWLRTKTGDGLARFTLLANAYSPQQEVAVFPTEAALTDRWQRIDLPFESFPRITRGALDLFTIEFIGKDSSEFMVDDFQLLGGWQLIE